MAATGQRASDGACRLAAATGPEDGTTLAYLTRRWPDLPPHIREAIATLVGAASAGLDAESD